MMSDFLPKSFLEWVGAVYSALGVVLVYLARKFILDTIEGVVKPLKESQLALERSFADGLRVRDEKLNDLKVLLSSIKATGEATGNTLGNLLPIVSGLSLSDGKHDVRIGEAERRISDLDRRQGS